MRDASRSSRNVVRVAMGRCRRQVISSPGETPAADGEVVWSWRRDPGATLAASLPPTTGAKEAAPRGEHEVSRQTIARGRPGCLGCTCQIRVRFLLPIAHGCCGCRRRPTFPAPSVREGANEIAKLRRKSRRENASVCLRESLHLAPLAGRGRTHRQMRSG